MSLQLRIVEPLGERDTLLPLSVGGEGAALVVPGVSGVALQITESARQWLARPLPDAPCTVNGLVLREPQVLDEGDVIGVGTAQLVARPAAGCLEVVHLAGNDTIAPLRQDVLPGDEVVAGVREIFAAGTGAPGAAGASRPGRARSTRRGPLVAAAAAVVAVAAIALWLFALVPVPLTLVPEAAQVLVPDAFSWQAGDRVFVVPGRHTLTISHPGYRSQSVTLDVTRALSSAAPLPVTLALLPGVLEVDTGGVEGELLVDGRVAGTVPGEVEVEAGEHDLIVRAPQHVDHVVHLAVEGGGKKQQLAAPLQSSMGWLVVDSAPAGAMISIDGQQIGIAPQRVAVEAGLRSLALSAPGRLGWNTQVAVIAGQTLDLGRIDLGIRPPAVLAPAKADADLPKVADSASPDAAASSAEPPPRPAPPARLQSALLGTLVLMPAGKYTQGSDRREQGRRANEAQREVTLTRPFYLAETEVTNAQFRVFRPAHVSGIALDKSLDLDRQPVTMVSWDDAVEFCNWLSLREDLPAAYERRDGRWQLVMPANTGYRLPTEAEWEYAARYVDGRRWQRAAWGDSLAPPPGAANLAGRESLPVKPGPDVRLASALPEYSDEHAVVAPVGSYARSPAGFFDMGGNVSEWVHDVYQSLPDTAPVADPVGATADGAHSIRGANWRTANIGELRLAWRDRAANPSQTLGFRVARFAQEAT